MPEQQLSRRKLLGALGAGSVITLAGCSSDSGTPDNSGTDPSTSSPRSTSEQPTNTPRSTETANRSEEGSDSASKGYNSELIFETEDSLSRPKPDGETLYASTDQLFAIGVNGREEWSVDLEGGTSSVPGITTESVFISTQSDLYAISRNDGSKTWTFSGNLSQRGPTPTGDDAVYVIDALSITAVNVSDGTERWQFRPEYIDSAPAVADGTVYVADASATFYAIDASSGDQVWSQPLPNSSNGSTTAPVIGDDTVFALSLTDSYESRITALSMADGTRQWSITLSRRARQRPAVQDGVLYIGDSSSTLYAIDTTDGSTLWQFSTDGHTHGSVDVLEETVCAGTSEGTVHAVNRDDGTEQWQFNPGPPVTSDPVAHEGVIYASIANRLYRLENN